MTAALQALIQQAGAQLGSEACAEGRHQWASEGGRRCPHPEDIGEGVCSQAVYRCTVCGVHDYGERGGPGHSDCSTGCQHKWRASDQSLWLAPAAAPFKTETTVECKTCG